MPALRLSALDLSPIPSGSTAGDALRNTIDLARHVEALGFTRTWLAEHHNAASLASSAPEIMIGQVAAATRTLRVGAGGIMLPNHSALKVAEVFRVLGALFPGRIDLGLGRAPGTDGRTALALRRSSAVSADDFPEQFRELTGYLDDDGAPRAGFTTSIRAIPTGVASPDLWVLGSSDFGAAFAAQHGLPFAFAHQINPADAIPTLRAYRDAFRPSARLAAPQSILALSVVCAESAAAAADLEVCARLSMLRFARGQRDLPMPSVEEARAHPWAEEDLAVLEAYAGRGIVDTIDGVRARLLQMGRDAQVDELMLMTHVHDHAARKRSYDLIRDAIG